MKFKNLLIMLSSAILIGSSLFITACDTNNTSTSDVQEENTNVKDSNPKENSENGMKNEETNSDAIERKGILTRETTN